MQYGWKEHWYNFESNLEVMGEEGMRAHENPLLNG